MAAPIPVSGSPASWLRGYLSRRGLGERGAVAVEFALIFPVFLFMILFMLDAGRYLTVQMALNNAASVGARAVSISQDSSITAAQVRNSFPDSLAALSTLDPSTLAVSVTPAMYLCPINSENYTTTDLVTGQVVANPDGNCVNVTDPSFSTLSCTAVGANYRAMSRAWITFKWITPLGLLVSLAKPSEFGPKASIYFKRNATDTTIIEGKAKLLCQN